MDFPKFVSLISKKALFFALADKLVDNFEGSWPVSNFFLRSESLAKISVNTRTGETTNLAKSLSKTSKEYARFTAINCWHANPYESVAMWKLYLQSNEGIAIRTTYENLKDSIQPDFEHPIYLGKVNYLNYKTDHIPSVDMLAPFIHKQIAFKYENEIRVVIIIYPKDDKVINDFSKPSPMQNGLYVPVNIDTVIERIYLAPSTLGWFSDLVSEICSKYGISKPIIPSELDELPVY
jgi:hypothetical protein